MMRSRRKLDSTSNQNCRYVNFCLIFITFLIVKCSESHANNLKNDASNSDTANVEENLDSSTVSEETSQDLHQPFDTRQNASIDLVLNDKRLSDYGTNLTDRHSYNVSYSQVDANSAQLASNDTQLDAGELSVSDSQLMPKSMSSRFDEDFDSTTTESDNPNDDDIESSNLSEKKVVKDLTKAFSKGMSGVSDQVKLETLEKWKRKQKERKVIKDNRAKLFEDLLSAAIMTHPEKVKKSKKPAKDSLNSAVLNNPDIEPDIAHDAEAVLQHLQGLASIVDHQSSPGEILPIPETAEESTEEDEADRPQEPAKSASEKGSSSSNDLTIVKGFKKIKNQILTRRKQLDQLKKILNPDSESEAKSESHKPKKAVKVSPLVQDDGEYTIVDDGSFSIPKRRKTQTNRASRTSDLAAYLKENPEILASVAAEFTANLENSRIGDDENNLLPTVEEFGQRYQRSRRSNGEHLRLHDSDNLIERNRASLDHRSLKQDWMQDLNASKRSLKFDNQPNDAVHSNNNHSPPSRGTTSEALLLQSLRERQLMNLARLEMVLAEKHQASSRSQVLSGLNPSSNSSHLSNAKMSIDRIETPQNHQTNNQVQNWPPNVRQNEMNSTQTDAEVLHHFMMMNQDNHLNFPMNRDITNPFVNETRWNPNQQLMRSEDYHSNYPTNPFADNFMSQQQVAPPLDRFRDWRDASQSRINSAVLMNKISPRPNFSWFPHDLTTGSSSTPVGSRRSPFEMYRDVANQKARADASVTRANLHEPQDEQTNRALAGTRLIAERRSRSMNPQKEVDAAAPDNQDTNNGESPQRSGQKSSNSNTPLDYFSAYKDERANEFDQANREEPRESSTKFRRSDKSRREAREKPVEAKSDNQDDGDDDGLGAMWAK